MNDDYRTMFDAKYIGAWDLPKHDVVLVIDRVEAQQLTNKKGTNKKPVVYFRGTTSGKGFVLNKTNGRAIAGMYGVHTSKWHGKPIALYATTTEVGGETVDCIRVRPQIPKKKPKDELPAQPPAETETPTTEENAAQ